MKKLFSGRFLFIVVLSLVVLILLGIGAFYLFDDADDTFVKSGYVLNPLSSKVEKYFFDKDTSYRENLSSMIEFNDVDNKNVKVLKDSFLHYLDGSLSFLKNGAILDLDSINGEEAVKFYNITSESIIEKDGNQYSIKNGNDDIKLKNFIGRISDNRYIVVGNLSAKLVGNDTRIQGDYFEIVYVEEGVVNIENKDIKYQVAADGSQIYVGDNLVIDLGDKKIMNGEKDVMSLTAITINGDENIEIIPQNKGNEEETDSTQNGGNNGNNEADQNEQGGATGNNGTGQGGTGQENVIGEKTNDTVVSLKDASVRSTGISVVFDVYNQKADDVFDLRVTNLETGRTIDMVSKVIADSEIAVNLLSPNTRYLFTVVNERDGGKYFQKIFETSDFGIKLERSYATDSSLGYKVTVDKGTDITNAKLTLYKFNEETKQNEVVTTSYHDSETGEIKTTQKVTYISSLEGNIEGVHEIVYDGLDSNTIYTAVLDEFSLASSNFKDIYNITLTSLTLKKTPSFTDGKPEKVLENGSFKLSLADIDDPDNAITGYTYLIYEKENPSQPVIDPIVKTNASPIEIQIGNGENQLKNDVNYFYRVVIEYFDNEKYIEYVTTDSINFMMGSDPYVTVVPNDDEISFDRIGATIYLIDNSCLISMPGREKCNDVSTAVVDVSKVNPITGEKTSVFAKVVDFTVGEDDITYDLKLNNLQPGTTYNIEVRADLNDDDDHSSVVILHTDESKMNITTKSLTSFVSEWDDLGSKEQHVVNTQLKFNGEEGTGTMSPEDSASAIKKVVVRLYDGDNPDNLADKTPIATKNFYNNATFNIKEKFYDEGYPITSDETFGLDINRLRELNSNGKLSEYYTIVVNAYYDEGEVNQVRLSNNVNSYRVARILLEDIKEPIINIDPIVRGDPAVIETKLNNPGTHVGYKVDVAFDRDGMLNSGFIPNKINLYVYTFDNRRVSFYIKDKNNNLVLVDKLTDDLGETNYYESKIYMDYGTEYSVSDNDVMRRGNNYYIGYVIDYTEGTTSGKYPSNYGNDHGPNVDYGIYDIVNTEKETPRMEMHIAKSTADSITYKYKIDDPDNALYRTGNDADYNFYYTIGNGEEKTLKINKNEDGTFDGSIKIDGLTNDDLYSLYYKKNITKTGDVTRDVVKYIENAEDGRRVFDGYYNAKDTKYNFKYKLINNNDNRVVIKVLADKKIVDRTVNYKVQFTTNGTNNLTKEIWKLSSCSELTTQEVDDDINRCFYVDYVDLKNADMQGKNISVKLWAFYDNGLTGYDYEVGENKDYPYMIFQNNLFENKAASYISFSNSGTSVVNWSEALDVGKGYHLYTISNQITYISKSITIKRNGSDTDASKNISYTKTSLGYNSSTLGILNPKMISIDEMNAENNENSFSFMSITPKVRVVEKSRLINGAVMDITLSGADLDDFKNEGTNSEKKYYLYIDTWGSQEAALSGNFDNIVRPTLKVEIANLSSPIQAVIDGLSSQHDDYYFNVYAYTKQKNNEFKKIQLFDAKYTDRSLTETYRFNPLKGQNIFSSLNVAYSANDSAYGKRDLDTTINLIQYKNAYPYNFDVMYVFCDSNDSSCGYEDSKTNIFKRTIANENVSKTIAVKDDISNYDLEFGKRQGKSGYYMYVYAVAKEYHKNGNSFDEGSQTVQLNIFSFSYDLESLKEPTFVVSRNAVYDDNGNPALDFKITVNDADRTLVDGKYYVRLLDQDNHVVGNLLEKDQEGNYVLVDNYENHAFDALVLNKDIRITNLSADTKYTIEVSGDAYLNNYSIPVDYSECELKTGDELLQCKDEHRKETRTINVKKTHTVYSVNDYGVAFGRDLLFSAGKTSILVTFLGGSSFENVVKVNYSIGLWDNDQSTNKANGTYVLGENNKRFEKEADAEDWSFKIDPPDMLNVLGQTYTVGLSFEVKNPRYNPDNPDDPENPQYVVLTSEDNPSFDGNVQYVEDKKNNN